MRGRRTLNADQALVRGALYDGVLDPDEFARLIGWSPDPWQRAVLWSRRPILLCCGRQGGKSTSLAPKFVYTAVTRPQSTCLIISRSERQAGELFRKVKVVFQALPWVETDLCVKVNETEIELQNGSRIVSLPGTSDTIVGFSAITLLAEDEAARVKDDVFALTRPMLAVSKGQHILASTPLGKRGHFWEQWDRGDNWQRIRIPSANNPRIDPDFLRSELRTLGPYWFEQEYCCKFQDAVGGIFTTPFVDEDEPSWEVAE